MNLITTQQIYWLTRCDALKNLTDVGGGSIVSCSLLILALWVLIYMIRTDCGVNIDDERVKKIFFPLQRLIGKLGVILLSCLIFCHLVHPFIPSTKEMAAIIVIPRIANSQSVHEIGEEVVTLAKEWLLELHPHKNGAEK